jgi:HAD superfamily hydrolase (TIGR01509 family)
VTPTVLLLDVMDTLVRDPFWKLPDFFGTDLRSLLADRDPEDWPRFERNEIDEQTFFDRCFADRVDKDLSELKAMFSREYRWIDGIESLLTDLQAAGVTMHALSNYPIWYRMVEEALGLSRYLPWTFVSHHTGVRKPHPDAYLGAAKTLGVAPETCLFVDDRGSNCKAAVAVGMQAIKFEGAVELRAQLRALGVPGA